MVLGLFKTGFGANKPKAKTFQERSGGSGRWANSSKAGGRRKVRVLAKTRETPNACTLALEFEDGNPINYEAGQYLTVIVSVDGVSCKRAYSFSSSPAAEGAPSITVKRVPGGVASNFINDNVEVGDRFEVLGPNGEFTAKTAPQAKRFVLIGGGSGITPLVSLAETLLAKNADASVTLLYGNKNPGEIIFRERLARLTSSDDRFRAVHFLEDRADTDAQSGFITAEAIKAHAGELTDTNFFVCGPEPLMDSAEAALLAAGVDQERIKLERFTFAARASGKRPEQGFAISFSKSSKQVQGEAGQTVLDAGLAAGIEMPFSCTMGGCGACKVKVTAGTVVMDEPNCLTPEEAAKGHILACCAYAAEPITVQA